MRLLLALPLLLAAGSLSAQPVITGISPTEGPTSGGTEVTITGVGFETASAGAALPPAVYFGGLLARASTVVNASTILAVTPASARGSVFVKVDQHNGSAVATARFTYAGESNDAYQRFLVPIFVAPVRGAYGSEFRSDLTLWNGGSRVVRVQGLWQGSVCLPCEGPVYLPAGYSATLREVLPGSPGLIVAVLNDEADALAANLRVYDTSRSSTNFGTEIPLVPLTAFRRVVDLNAVPNDPRFRLMLRIYGSNVAAQTVQLQFPYSSQASTNIALRAGYSNVMQTSPAYAEVPLVPPSDAPATLNLRLSASESSPIWAFIAVTNNETQHITTITPQPSR